MCSKPEGCLLLLWRCPVYRWRELVAGAGMEQENLSPRYRRPVEMGEVGPLAARGRTPTGGNRKRQSADAGHRDGPVCSSDEGPVMGPEQRGRADQVIPMPTLRGRSRGKLPKQKVKSFDIPKRLVFRAWEKVRANDGAPGVDAVSIDRVRQTMRGTTSTSCGTGCPREAISWTGAGGGDTERPWGRGQDLGCAEYGRPSVPDRSGDAAGGEVGADLPP